MDLEYRNKDIHKIVLPKDKAIKILGQKLFEVGEDRALEGIELQGSDGDGEWNTISWRAPPWYKRLWNKLMSKIVKLKQT